MPAKPDSLKTDSINLEIRLQDVPHSFTQDLVMFGYYTDPTPLSMQPSVSPRAGGIQLLVQGVLFFSHADLRCRFGQGGTEVRRGRRGFEARFAGFGLGSRVSSRGLVRFRAPGPGLGAVCA